MYTGGSRGNPAIPPKPEGDRNIAPFQKKNLRKTNATNLLSDLAKNMLKRYTIKW